MGEKVKSFFQIPARVTIRPGESKDWSDLEDGSCNRYATRHGRQQKELRQDPRSDEDAQPHSGAEGFLEGLS